MAGGYQQCIYKGISVFSYTAISANNNLPKSGLSARGDRGSLPLPVITIPDEDIFSYHSFDLNRFSLV